MFKEPYEVVSLKKHSDKRGDLFEILRFKDQKVPGEGYIYCFSINPGERRGDHYHTKKLEWMSCVAGEAVILVESEEGKKEKVVMSADDPKVIYFGPGTSHSVLNEKEEPAVVVSYGSKQFDPSDTDTVSKFIEF